MADVQDESDLKYSAGVLCIACGGEPCTFSLSLSRSLAEWDAVDDMTIAVDADSQEERLCEVLARVGAACELVIEEVGESKNDGLKFG